MMNSLSKFMCVFLGMTFCVLTLNAQNAKVDSLQSVLKKEENQLKRIDLLNELFNAQYSEDFEKGLAYAQNAYDNATSIQDQNVESKRRISESANNVGVGYYLLDNYEKALEYLLIALKVSEEIQDTNRMSNALFNLSNLYDYKGDVDKSVEYLLKAINLYKNKGDMESVASGYANLAAMYFYVPDYEKGMVYYEKSLVIADSLNDQLLLSILYDNRAVGLKKMNRFDEALEFHQKSIAIDEDFDNQEGLVTSYLNVADLYAKMGRNSEAVEYNTKSLELAQELNKPKNIMLAYLGLSEVYRQSGQSQKAIEALEQYANWKDTLYSQENAQAIAEMQTKYDTEKKEAENKLLKTEQELDRAELKRQSSQRTMLLIGLLIALAIVGYVAYSLIQKKKVNRLLNEQNDQIVSKNVIIEEKNKNITDSINYAQRIQNAILPSADVLSKHFKSFIYYLPKDIVSGDFYWVKEQGDRVFFSVVDCTGHGVPGAFMSIIGFNSLNRIVEESHELETGKVLDKLNDLVLASIVKESEDGLSIKDGMDLSFCCYNKTTNKLEYSGAYNSLYVIRKTGEKEQFGVEARFENEGYQLFEIKADKMAIGGNKNNASYQTHSITIESGDTIYLFSDGYADQFGGPKGKKFMYKQFKQVLLSMQGQTMENQMALLNQTLMSWKGDLDQLDDICVVGVRF